MTDETPQGRRKERLTLLRDTLTNSSFVGLSHIASARSWWIKAFWSVVVISGVVGFSFNFYGLVARFTTFPVTENYDPNSDSFVWPDITLCNPTNPIPFWKFRNAEKVWKALINRTYEYSMALTKIGNKIKKNNQLAMNTISPHEFKFDENIASFVMDAVKNSDSNEMALVYDDGKSINFPFSETYKGYYFPRSVPNKFPTPCLTFNPVGFGNLSERIRLSSSIERIQLFIMMNQESYNLFDSYRESPRLQVFISAPGHAVSNRRIYRANAGSDAYFKFSMRSYKRLRHRGKCIEEPFQMEVFDVMMSGTQKHFGDFYDCRISAIQEKTVEICKCYNPSRALIKLPNITFPRICYNMTLFSPDEVAANLKCMKSIFKNKELGQEIWNRCSRYKKKDPCEEIVYDVSQEALSWPQDMSPSRAEFLENLGIQINVASNGPKESKNGWKQYLRDNLVYLHLEVHSEATPMIAEEYSYTGAQFISDIGGIVGLWLGLSIISAFELVSILHGVGRYFW